MKKFVHSYNFNIDKWVMENSDVLIETDDQGNLITFINKNIIHKKNINSIVNTIKIDDIKSSELLIVNPNYRWTDHNTTNFISDTKLAYSMTFVMTKPYNGDLTVWIDSENGDVLGSYISK